MNRRFFLATTVAAGLGIGATPALAGDMVDYTPGLIDTALEEGKTVFIDYSASWCSTCRRQARVINALREENPDYDDAMIFVKVDWDTYRNHDVTVMNDVPRRSTLILLRGDDELGRLVAGTSETDIKALMDMGLDAAS